VEPAPGSERILPAQPDTPPSELFPGRVERRAVAFQSSRPSVAPLSPARYRVQFTASAELRNKLERLKDLMRHEVPDGDLGAIVERAVTEKLERLEARRFAKTAAPRPAPAVSRKAARSRHIPAAVRRAAIARVGVQCGFVDDLGRRCRERDRLEFHHRHPFGMGGEHSPSNIGLLCSAHNRLMAERDYGTAAIEPAARHHRSG
jgi:hypothetical protein